MITPEDVFVRRQRYWRHGYRPLAVWNADQETDDEGEPLKNPGKQPRGQWTKAAAKDPPEAVRSPPDPRALNTGLLCGDIVAFDVDVLDEDLADRIVSLIERRLGVTPLVRIGRAPKTLLVYRPDQHFRKAQTPELFFPDGTKAKVELLAEGQQFVADGVHPDTHEPYRWTEDSPTDVPLDELPVVSEEDARAIVAEAEKILRQAGAREKEKPQTEHPKKPNGNAGDFFTQVKTIALNNIGAWVRSLFPKARFEPGTGAWRVSSKDLGRSLEEDISIHPGGIRDFGEEKALSSIDLVMRYGSATSVVDAALWLCGAIGVEPALLGYRKEARPPAGLDPKPSDLEPKPVADRILTGAAFVASFQPPDWLIDGIIQRGRLYGCTSLTGHGKTAVWLYNSCMIHVGRFIGRLETEPSNVLILAGENPEDLQARMLGMTQAFNLGVHDLPYALPATFPLNEEENQKLQREIKALDVPFGLILVDTAASFFSGDEENDNVQAGFYGRTLRTLTTCDGHPAVVALCHPIKHATPDNLLPRGGGAFLNELDGNLTLWSEQLGESTVLHWQGKIRGPDFDPLTYRLKSVNTGYQDIKGRDVPTIVATPLDEMEAAHQAATAVAHEDAVLASLHNHPERSLADIAQIHGWTNNEGKLERWRVQRALKNLERDKLVRKFRRKWHLTDAGKATVKGE